MSVLFNLLSSFVIAFLPQSKHLLISWLKPLSTVILEPKKIKLATVSIFFPIYLLEVTGSDAITFDFWMLRFNPAFSFSSFTLIKRLFSSSLLSAIRVVSATYLWLFMFLLAIFIPACESSSLAFHVICSTYKLNKRGNNIQPSCTPFPILSQSVVPCPVLTCFLACI